MPRRLLKQATDTFVSRGACLRFDIGNADCYPGSGTTISNLVGSPADGSAQTAYDFYRGDGVTSTTYPTFNGSAGGLSSAEYLSFDGGDFCDLKSGANTTFIKSLSKSGAVYSFWAVIYTLSSGNTHHIFSTAAPGGAAYQGITFGHEVAGALNILVYNNAGGTPINVSTSTILSTPGLHFVGLSLVQGTGSFFYADGAYAQVAGADTFNGTYSSPSSSDPVNFAVTQDSGDHARKAGNGTRSYMLGLHNVALTKAEMDQIYNLIKNRYSLP